MLNNSKLKQVEMDNDSESSEKVYKSCFARSVAVNSKFQDSKVTNRKHSILRDNCKFREFNNESEVFLGNKKFGEKCETLNDENIVEERHSSYRMESVVLQRHRGISEDYLLRSTHSGFLNNSADNSTNVVDFSVENLALKSQVETLQWQLKQTEESREMYQAVMKQVVLFLEKAHRSLENLGNKLIHENKNASTSLSQYEIDNSFEEEHLQETSKKSLENCNVDDTPIRDFSWRRRKKDQTPLEEIPPEKLSQEAFRLLRTAESLLNTHEPDLVNLTPNRSPSPAGSIGQDQLSYSPEKRFQRPPFAASTPQLAGNNGSLNRKAVLRRQHALKCNSFHAETFFNNSFADGADFDPKEFAAFANESKRNFSRSESFSSQKSSGNINKRGNEPEISVTPPMSSVSSAEDESGFSSMNSFQEIGIPIVSYEENKSKEALLRSMLHEGGSRSNSSPKKTSQEDRKLWQTPDNCMHKRWSSSPVEGKVILDKPLKVLWV